MNAIKRISLAILSGVLVAAFALCASHIPSSADSWPQRPIRIIVPFAPGGAVDLVARLLQEPMAKALGTSILVENRAGGASVPASETLVRATPDGYTIGVFSSNYASNAIMRPNLSFDVVNDVTPISMVVINTVLILVPAESSIHSLADLIEQAKARPGTLSYGTPGFGTAMHFAGELLKTRTQINIVHVPYRGAGPALNDLLGKQLPIAIMGIGPAIPFIKEGKIRPIAITTEKRSKILPDVPTVAELGYPGYRFGEWFAMIAPKGLPPEIHGRIHAAFVNAINSEDTKAKLERVGLEPTSSTPEQLRTFLATEVTRIRKIADEAKMHEQKN